MKYILFAVISSLLFSGVAYADGYGQTLDKAVGNYIANVDYDSFTPEISAGSSKAFSFQLWNKARTQTVSFGDVSVNIFQQGNPDTIFTGTLSGGFGQAGMSLAFQDAGAYTIKVRFHSDTYETLAEASFPLEVGPSNTTYEVNALWLVLASGTGFVAGVALMLAMRRRASSQSIS